MLCCRKTTSNLCSGLQQKTTNIIGLTCTNSQSGCLFRKNIYSFVLTCVPIGERASKPYNQKSTLNCLIHRLAVAHPYQVKKKRVQDQWDVSIEMRIARRAPIAAETSRKWKKRALLDRKKNIVVLVAPLLLQVAT